MSVRRGERCGGGRPVVRNGPPALVHQYVVAPAHRHTGGQIGATVVGPRRAVVDLGDGAVAAGEGAAAAVAEADGPPLRPLPLTGVAAHIEHFAPTPGDDAVDAGVAGQPPGRLAAQWRPVLG